MQTRIEDAERIYSAAKQLLAEQRKYARIQERALALADATPRQRQKQNTDLNWQAFHIVKLEASLHAACVDAGIADSGEVVSVAVSMAMAKADGWVKNAKYQTMPEHMLRWRSAAMLIRLYAPEVMLGIQSVEEVEDTSAGAARDVTPLRPAPAAIGVISAQRPSGPPRIGQAPPAKPEPAPAPTPDQHGPDEEAEACVAQFEQDAAHARTEQDLEDCAAIVAPMAEGDRLSRAQRDRIEAAMEAARQQIAAAAAPGVEQQEEAEEAEPEIDPQDPDYQRGIADRKAGQKKCVISAIRETPDRMARWKAGFDSLDDEAA